VDPEVPVAVSFAVMAHPKRERFVDEYLVPRLPEGTPVVYDRVGDRWETGSRAICAYLDGSPDATHHVVVQDDALLSYHFVEGVERALEHVPADAPASFYIGRARPHGPAVARAVHRAQRSGSHWLVTRGPIWGPCIAMPTVEIPDALKWCGRLDIPNYDTRLMMYFADRGTPCWYTVPTLVDHRVGAENPSLVPGRSAGATRVAHAPIGDDDPREIDWSTAPHREAALEDYWHEGPLGKTCSQCGQLSKTLEDAIVHAFDHFGGEDDGERVCVASYDLARQEELRELWERLPERVRGASHRMSERGQRPWLVLVWDDVDYGLAGGLPTMGVEAVQYWKGYAETLGGSGIRLNVA
jgi:hypothetical protein